MQDETVMVPVPNQGVPMPRNTDRADFLDKVKPEQVAEIMRHKLLGENWNGSDWIKIPSLKDSALSERGAWDISNLMLGAGSINISMGKLSSAEINARIRNLIKEAMIMLIANWKEYNIKNTSQFYFVKSIIFSNARAVWSHANEGSFQELFKTIVSENRMVNTEKKEPGKLRRLLGMSQ